MPRPETEDQDLQVFTAGWGLRYVEETNKNEAMQPQSSCITDEVGPAAFRPCSGGWQSCDRVSNPPVNSKCFQFESRIFTEDVYKGDASIVEVIGDLNLTCYPR